MAVNNIDEIYIRKQAAIISKGIDMKLNAELLINEIMFNRNITDRSALNPYIDKLQTIFKEWHHLIYSQVKS